MCVEVYAERCLSQQGPEFFGNRERTLSVAQHARARAQ
jgi:hypothetical protein